MVTNVTIEYVKAERKYLEAKTDEERLKALEEMLRCVPKHKGTETLIAKLKQRYKKLKEKIERKERLERERRGGISFGIEKRGIQVCIYGLPNSGKSLLLSLLTNAKPKVSEVPFTTTMPEIGMLSYNDVEFQLIEFPSLYLILEDDKRWLSFGLTTDLILILARSADDAKKVVNELFMFNKEIAKKELLVVINEPGVAFSKEKQTFESQDKAIRKTVAVVHCDLKIDYDRLKDEIFNSLTLYRIYLKPPGQKQPDQKPLVFLHRPTIAEVLEEIKIDKQKVLKAVVYGKSVRFSGQSVSLEHVLMDKDVVEFHIKKL
jgi:ribosome-interacting GTPase 1